MKKIIHIPVILIVIISVISISCNDQTKEAEEPVKIENTLQSVSFFKDTVGNNPQLLLEAFSKINEAIDEIGYPNAGYKLWLIQSDTTDIRFMIEGFWTNQEVYDIIHDNQLYKDAMGAESGIWDGLVSVKYNRFIKVK